jgi:hypothetical protein
MPPSQAFAFLLREICSARAGKRPGWKIQKIRQL